MNLDFKDLNVLLVGDFMVDQYIFCSSTRMSPEAPVPVLNPEKIYSTPGGAGNVAFNLSALGASVTCVGCIGSDSEGNELTQLLEEKDINTELLCTTGLPTTIKRRYYANGNQVLRVI
jgi:rfaE bifunctional protein kinase chain/domain